MSEKKMKQRLRPRDRKGRREQQRALRAEDYSLRRPSKSHGGKPPNKRKNRAKAARRRLGAR